MFYILMSFQKTILKYNENEDKYEKVSKSSYESFNREDFTITEPLINGEFRKNSCTESDTEPKKCPFCVIL